MDDVPDHTELHGFNTKSVKVVYLPTHMPLSLPLDQEIIKTFKAHDSWYLMGRIINTTEENSDRQHHQSMRGLCHQRCHHCYRKGNESHQAWNSKFLLDKTVPRYCSCLHKIYNRFSQENHEKYDECGKNVKVNIKTWILEKFKS